jgi:23S rRNA pseudouridine2605 synthase
VCLISGKNREVRKIFNHFDMDVSRLKRTRFGPIFLPSTLSKGKSKLLSQPEIVELSQYGAKK